MLYHASSSPETERKSPVALEPGEHVIDGIKTIVMPSSGSRGRKAKGVPAALAKRIEARLEELRSGE